MIARSKNRRRADIERARLAVKAESSKPLDDWWKSMRARGSTEAEIRDILSEVIQPKLVVERRKIEPRKRRTNVSAPRAARDPRTSARALDLEFAALRRRRDLGQISEAEYAERWSQLVDLQFQQIFQGRGRSRK
jgi:hypothetical protein